MSDDHHFNGWSPQVRGMALTAQVAAAERLSRTLVSGFQLCDEADTPLSQRQMAALIEAALLEFDGIESEVTAVLTVEELLARLRSAD